jgi:hypothetical protein
MTPLPTLVCHYCHCQMPRYLVLYGYGAQGARYPACPPCYVAHYGPEGVRREPPRRLPLPLLPVLSGLLLVVAGMTVSVGLLAEAVPLGSFWGPALALGLCGVGVLLASLGMGIYAAQQQQEED